MPEASCNKEISIQDLSLQEDVFQRALQAAPLIYDTGPEYFDFIFGNRDNACDALASWFCRSDSEFAGTSASLLFINKRPAGLAIIWPGLEAPKRRRADALALIKAVKNVEREELQRRLSLVHRADSKISNEREIFIRSIAVGQEDRGRGLGKILLHHCLENGLARGYNIFRLDVRSGNKAALELYRRSGFSVVCERTAPHFGWAVSSMMLER